MIKFNLIETLNNYKDDLVVDDDDDLSEELLLEQILNNSITQDERLLTNTLGYIQRMNSGIAKQSLKLLDAMVQSLTQSSEDKLSLEVLAYLIHAFLIKFGKLQGLNKNDFASWFNVLSSSYVSVYKLLNETSILKLWGNSVEKDTFVRYVLILRVFILRLTP